MATATPAVLEVACTDVEQGAMAAARLQLRRMVRERADAVARTLRLGRD
jgi:predicted negative regulator of RcsB-dependent stress response